MILNIDGIELNLKLGADPEVFASRAGKIFSAHGLVKGTKENPHPVPKGAIQVDGMALEFNIDPSDTRKEFVDNILSVLESLKTSIPKDVSLSIVPTAEFGKEYIDSQPPIAKELGCSPDLNAYTGSFNIKPNADVPFRTAAGHIHLGWTEQQDIDDPDHMHICCELTKVLDLYLGVPSVLLDSDTKRRSLYGAAGAFRSKDYGMEYRVLSNFWLKSPEFIAWAYDQTVLAVSHFLAGFRVADDAVCNTINYSDSSVALNLIKQHNIRIPNA